MGDYHDLYLKTDALLLASVFEKFISTCLDYYGLDPCHYFVSPGLSSNEQKITSKEQEVTSNEQKVTSNEQKVTSNESKVTSNEQTVTSNEQKL